jgi:protein O-GlcNAc transferase
LEKLKSATKALAADMPRAGESLAEALLLHKSKNHAAAWKLYEKIISIEPQNAEALHLMGVLAAQRRDHRRATELILKAIEINPLSSIFYCNLANALQGLQQYDEAVIRYEQAIHLQPDYTEAYYNRGVALQAASKFSEAIDSYRQAIHLNPDYAEAYNNLGFIEQELGDPIAGQASYLKALELKPDLVEAHNNLGNILHLQGDAEGAISRFQRAIQLNPSYVQAWFNCGNALQSLKRFNEAIDCYDQAIQIDQTHALSYCNKGNALLALKNLDAAIGCFGDAIRIKPDHVEAYYNLGGAQHACRDWEAAAKSYAEAIALEPGYVAAHHNRGAALAMGRKFPEALKCLDQAVFLNPDYVDAYISRGNVLKELRDFEGAVENYRKALILQPDAEFLLGTMLYTRNGVCDWQGFQNSTEQIAKALQQGKKASAPFPLLGFLDEPGLQKTCADIWIAHHHPPVNAPQPFTPRLRKDNKICIGYFSADFHEHATSYLMAELFERHDKSRFEIVAFSFGPDRDDRMRKRLLKAFDQFHDVRGKSTQDIVNLSRKIGIDIAIDLKGFTTDARTDVLAHRCAPIQVNYLGYPGTMGADYMDYILADPVVIPAGSEVHYSEQVVRLPHSYQVNDRFRPIAQKTWTRADLGLPEDGFVFCCFNNNYKILPDTFGRWMHLLQQVENSVLWLFEAYPGAAENLRKAASQHGIAAHRLVFAKPLPLAEHLARYPLADLFLDTYPYNAHTTASDALWAGLPVLTLAGQSFASRVAASLLTAIELPELITETPEAYTSLALALAKDAARLSAIRTKLRHNRLATPLFNTGLFTQHMEMAYTAMHQRHLDGLPPAPISIAAQKAPDQQLIQPTDFETDALPANPNVQLEEMLKGFRDVLKADGLDAVFQLVERLTASDGQHVKGRARILSHLASPLLKTDSPTALALLDKAHALAPEETEPRYIPISYFINTGQAVKARDAARFVIEAETATPLQVIIASQVLADSSADAEKALLAAMKAFEELGRPLGWASSLLDAALKGMQWDIADELIRQLSQAHEAGRTKEARETPRTHVLWCANEAHNLAAAVCWSERELPMPAVPLPPVQVQPLTGRRLRVGYLSGDFRNHPTSFLVNGLLRNHDKSSIELFAYCSGWDDGSDMRQTILSHFEHVHSVQGMDDAAAAGLIRSHGIDVLVELNGPTRANRMEILAYRPAPVQIDYLGFPGSVGGRVVDYVVGDAYTVPLGSEQAYPEKIIRLDSVYQVNDYAAFPPLPEVSRAMYGLPEGVPVLGMFNAMNKVRNEVWAVWMRILHEVPQAVLWILDPGEHTDKLLDRFTKAHGITQGKRIYIASKQPQRDHLARLQCADLMLDPWPYGGHTTTSDALFAGVPVLALQGTNFAGRVSGALLKAAGLASLVQPTKDAYVATAVHLLRDRPDELARLRRFVREQVPKTDVFSAEAKTRQLEAAYRTAFERAASGLAFEHLNMQWVPLQKG